MTHFKTTKWNTENQECIMLSGILKTFSDMVTFKDCLSLPGWTDLVPGVGYFQS